MKERVLKVIDYYGINKNKFYKQTGFSNGFLDKEGTIGCDKLEIILNIYPDIDPDWLITGKGNMFRLNNLINVKESLEDKNEILILKDVDQDVIRHYKNLYDNQMALVESQKQIIELLREKLNKIETDK
jgi:hypothetical protein